MTACYFNDEQKMFAWLSGHVGQHIHSFKCVERYNKMYDSRIIPSLIVINEIGDLKRNLKLRKQYVSHLNACDTLQFRAQKALMPRRGRLIGKFSYHYNLADTLADEAVVWHGEI